MATFQASLRALAAHPPRSKRTWSALTAIAARTALKGAVSPLLFLPKSIRTREMDYVNAGHNDPILRRASRAIERLATGGPPLGLPLFTDDVVPYSSGRMQLQPGDLLFIFTDGVVEAINDSGEEFGEARLLPCIQNAPAAKASDETLKRVMADVNAFVGSARQHDDITCLVLRVTA